MAYNSQTHQNTTMKVGLRRAVYQIIADNLAGEPPHPDRQSVPPLNSPQIALPPPCLLWGILGEPLVCVELPAIGADGPTMHDSGVTF